MKKYHYCFFFLLGFVLLCLGAGIFFIQSSKREYEPVTIPEETKLPEIETQTVAEDQIVINQRQVKPAPAPREEKKFLLVSEDGFLLVFGSHPREICLYTHIPISDFPEEEQEKLRQGIWFWEMEEVYSYLESYTS